MVEDVTEPIAVTLREERGGAGLKIIWWYVAKAIGEQVAGTQMASESFESVWLEAGAALERLTFKMDAELVAKAWEIVKDNETSAGKEII
jgi:hypothetical protein